MSGRLLEIAALEAGYGQSRVLFGLDLAVASGELVTLIGRNGMGKTTTLRSIMGLLTPKAGRIRFDGQEIAGWPSHRVARAGLALVPEGRQVFPNLTVHEQLIAFARPPLESRQEVWDLARVYDLFPQLEARPRHFGNQLSGGEQQMLAIGRALMTNPKLLLLDEASEGLTPRLQGVIWQALAALKAAGLAILVVDKNVAALARIADRHTIIEKGLAVWTGTSAELAADGTLETRYLSV